MSLEEFKFIYWMEYAHRMWGRALGVVFAVPAVYFAARGWVNGPLARRLGLLFAMGATQGFVGWWMVRSGLQVRSLFSTRLLDNPARCESVHASMPPHMRLRRV
jgi:heme A synthase